DSYAITHEDELPPLTLTEMAAHARAHLLQSAAALGPDTDGGSDIEGPPDEQTQTWAQLMRALAAANPAVADSKQWREAEDITTSEPLFTSADTVRVSPSQVESFTDCALRWFLTRNGGDRPSSTAQNLGTIIHAAAENYPEGPTSAIPDYLQKEFHSHESDAEWRCEGEFALGVTMADRDGEEIMQPPEQLGAVVHQGS